MKSFLTLLKEEDAAVKEVNATEEVIDFYLEKQSTSNSEDASFIEEMLVHEYEVLTKRKEKLSECHKAIRQYLSQI